MGISGLVIGQDVTTAIFGALNAGYFGGYLWQSTTRRSRRIGAAALTLVSSASIVEAVFSQSLFWSQRGDVFSNGMWALLRLPLLAATLLISAIIIRRALT